MKVYVLVMFLVVAMSVFALQRTPFEGDPVQVSAQTQSVSVVVPDFELISARAWGMFSIETGEVLGGSEIDTEYPIASVTKLFTAYAILQSSQRDSVVTITASDVATEGRSGKLIQGDTYSLYELLFPILLESSNDAAVATKRSMGAEYTQILEEIREELKLIHTTLSDSTGLSPRNVSTVHDLARFFSFLKRTEPHLVDITQLDTYVTERTGYINNNPVHQYENYRGGKHGFTDEAQETFVGSFKLPQGEIGIILLGSTDIAEDIDVLLSYQ